MGWQAERRPWLTTKPNGKVQVRYRDAGGRTRTLGTYATREEAERAAESFTIIGDPRELGKKSRAEAEAMYRSELIESYLANGQPVPVELLRNEDEEAAPIKVRDPLAQYLRQSIETDRDLKTNSRRAYLGALRYIESADLGRMDVRLITPRDIDHFWQTVEAEDGLRRVIWTLLSKAFHRAVRHDLRSDNPFERTGITMPASKPRRLRGKITTREKLEALAVAARSPQARVAILLMGYCGLRPGEVGGLRVQDFDQSACELWIEQQVVRGDRDFKPVLAPPKNGSQGLVKMDPKVCKELRLFVKANPSPDGLIFHAARGGLWANRDVNREVRYAAKVVGIDVHAHLLRHLAGSLALQDGWSVAEVSAMLRHKSIQETLDTYVEELRSRAVIRR